MTEEAIFAIAWALTDPADRAAYLDRVCAGNPALRRGVEELLRCDKHGSDDSLEPPPVAPAPTEAPGPTAAAGSAEWPGARLGPYKLLQKLGEGGMGTVWLVEQREPVKRRVALKVIKAGMDSARVLARFEAERQALALMDHPHIAKILDAGATPGGRPYFVMELVKGIPITAYCDQERLTPRQRLDLFVGVCQAVEHAHQKGVLHRDLKPSNVLVALCDGRPIPKVIDFGIAKATVQPLTEGTAFTEMGQVVGTPEHMAPEQADPNNLDVDTRADVYALGVLLYELLTGSLPLPSDRLRSAAFTEMVQIIREVEPPRPSVRLAGSPDLPSLAAKRRLDPRKLPRLVRGDLDWIAMKCLEKERGRRYETASALAQDVQRHLADEPVQAGPPSAAYRLRKFLRRNRGPVLAAVLVLLALLAGVVGTTVGLVRAVANEEKAQKRLRQTEKANEILASIFRDLNPRAEEKGGPALRVRLAERLDQAVEQLDGEAVGDPLTVARLQNILGVAQRELGYPQQAIALLTKSRQTFLAHLGPDHPDTLNCLSNLAATYPDAGRRDEALPLFEEVLERRKTKWGPDHPDTLASMNNLAAAYREAGRLKEALPLCVQALEEMRAKLGPDHFDTLNCMNNLAYIYCAADQLDKALPLFKEALERREAKLGPDHADTLTSMSNLARAYKVAGQLEKALPMYEKALERREAKLGPDHPDTLTSMSNLAVAYWSDGRFDRSVSLFEKTLRLMQAKYGLDHPETLLTMAHLGVNYRDQRRFAEAIPLLEDAWNRAQKLPSPFPGRLASIPYVLAQTYDRTGECVRSEPLYRRCLERARNQFGVDDLHTAGPLDDLGRNLLSQRKFAEAEQVLRECLAVRGRQQPEAWTTCNTRSLLGASLLGQEKYADAEPLLVQGCEGLKQREDKIPAPSKIRLTEALERLVQLYDAWGKKDKADEWRAKLEAARAPAKP